MEFHLYAISEAFIVFAVLYSAAKLFSQKQFLGALGLACFGAAAALGVYRFGMGEIEPLANIHRIAGQIGGLAGLSLITVQMFQNLTAKTNGRLPPLGLGLIFVSLIAAFIIPAIAVPLFLLWGIGLVIGAFLYVRGSLSRRLLWALASSLILVAVIFVRRSPVLGPDMSWHAFHTLVALWVLLIYCILRQTSRL